MDNDAIRALAAQLRIGPRRPEPFEDGKIAHLAQCPKCSMKGVLFFNAPTEYGYVTACVKCRARHVIHPKGVRPSTVVREMGGFTPELVKKTGRLKDGTHTYDGTKFAETARLRRELGPIKARSLGVGFDVKRVG